MWKKFFKWLKGLSTTVPNVNEKLATAVDDKIKSFNKQTAKEMEKYTKIMHHDYLETFFNRKYLSDMDSELAFDTLNRSWKKLCRDVNSSNRNLTLKKDEFERQVKIVLEKRKKKLESEKK